MIRSALLNASAALAGSVRLDNRAVESTTAPRSRLASRAFLTALLQRGCVPEPTVAVLGRSREPAVPTSLAPNEPRPFADKPGTPTAAVPNAGTIRQTDAPCQLSRRLLTFRDDSWPVRQFRIGRGPAVQY
jgi:hypothetical protein